jgi:SAM-dependent methyltransferase
MQKDLIVLQRSKWQKFKDLVSFPLRAISLFVIDRWGLSSLRTERFDYCASQIQGYCLDVGCGPENLFIKKHLNGYGRGIDNYCHDGLTQENVVEDLSRFPFEAETFDTVTFIACLNHVPKSMRDLELAEAYRCLKSGGNIIVTMGVPLAEILVHQAVRIYDRIFQTKQDLDWRGLSEEEHYFLTEKEICTRLDRAGFIGTKKIRFGTQWGLNAMYVAWKPTAVSRDQV